MAVFSQAALGGLVHRVDEREDAVAAVDEPVTVLPADARLEQRCVEHLVQRAAELGLHWIGSAGRTLDSRPSTRTATPAPNSQLSAASV